MPVVEAERLFNQSKSTFANTVDQSALFLLST